MVTIEIDGKSYQAEKGTMLIKVADEAGIDIPRFCYHKKLSVAANCRMCLVEVEKAPKPLPACATPVMDGMKVNTRSNKALVAQKSVMEFLLINHPLDCPICDQGGECELQDVAVGYGKDASRYAEGKRVVFDKNIGPLIATEMTRCIHCTRCVRFGVEIAGIQELGATGRGEHTKIGTYIERSVDSELSGNVIDLCPVGALTNKVFRFSARSWELTEHNSIAPHDMVGSNVAMHIQQQTVKRIVPAENEAVNEVWLADRDRYSYQGLNAADRLSQPMIKHNGEWHATDWETALQFAVDNLKNINATGLGALASDTATLEELYLLQKLLRGLGSHNIDHRLRQTDFSDQAVAPLFPALGQAIGDLEKVDTAFIIGSNIRKEQPLLNHRLRKASMGGGKMLFLNSVEYDFNLTIAANLIVPPTEWLTQLAGVAKALLETSPAQVPAGLEQLVSAVAVTDEQRRIAEQLSAGQKTTILLGGQVVAHSQFAALRGLAGAIAQMTGSQLGYVAGAGNTAGAWLTGVLPHRGVGGKALESVGLNAQAMLQSGLKGYVLLGLEPELDSCNGSTALNALNNAEFVVAMTAFRTEAMNEYANVLLPISLYPETSGTFINGGGQWQSFTGAVTPPGETRPAWKILRVLGNLFELAEFDYTSSEEVRDEAREAIRSEIRTSVAQQQNTLNQTAWQLPDSLSSADNQGLQRITELPIYAVDALVRRANALQKTHDARIALGIHANSTVLAQAGLAEATQVQVQQGDASVVLPIVVDERLADDCVLIYAGQIESMPLGSWQGAVTLRVAQ